MKMDSFGDHPNNASSGFIEHYKFNEKRRVVSVGNNSSNGSSKTRAKLSTDPQSVAARERRHRISDRFRTLRSLVPGGTKMDTVSMLEEAIHYVKFLKAQVWLLHQLSLVLPVDHELFAAHAAIAQMNAAAGGCSMNMRSDSNHDFVTTMSTQQPVCKTVSGSVQQQKAPLSPSLPPLPPSCFVQGDEEMILDLDLLT